jgi:hypothetical protein
MAIYCEFISLIIPIINIDRVYPGGFESFKNENLEKFDKVYWHDNHLFRQGAMDYDLLYSLIIKWEKFGLRGKIKNEGIEKWLDFCVIEFGNDNLNPPCDWIEYIPSISIAYFKGSSSNTIIGPNKKGFLNSPTSIP